MPRLGLGLGLGSLIGRPSVGGSSPVVPFSPTDIPELELWLDANEGTLNVVGNYFTDETASIELAGFPETTDITPRNPNGTISRNGSLNGKPFYSAGSIYNDRYETEVYWGSYLGSPNRWILEYYGFTSEGEPAGPTFSLATGNTDYPWQATWSDGTLTRTATTVDIPATNDQPVAGWKNRVSAKPSLIQPGEGARPTYKDSVYGRKALLFNSDALFNSGFSTFGQAYSYYIVSTSLLGSTNTSAHAAVRLGTNTTPTFLRGLFGASQGATEGQSFLAVQNSSTARTTSLQRSVSNDFGVFSARFDLTNGNVKVGRNLSSETTTGNNTSSANSTFIVIGAGSTGGSNRPINSNFSEVLVYNAYHDDATAQQIINYLVQKWNINTAL